MKALAMVLLACLPAGAQAYVNSNSSVSTGGLTASTTLLAVGAGHAIIAECGSKSSPTISHTATGSFTQASQYSTSFWTITTWYLCNTASGNDTITCNESSLTAIHFHAYEVSGLATSSCVDQANSQLYSQANGSDFSLSVSTSGATTTANEMVVAAFFNPGTLGFQTGTGGTDAVFSLSTCTYKEKTIDAQTATGAMGSAYLAVSTTGTKTCSGSSGVAGQNFPTAISTYKQAAAAPSGTKTLLILGIGED